MEEKNTSLHNFSLEEFRRSYDEMIATSETSYKGLYNISNVRRVKEYTEEDVKHIIESGTAAAQSELSYNYFSIDGFYRRIIIYYATFLKYLGILIPDISYGSKITDKTIQKQYYKALDFSELMNIQTLCIDFATKALVNGCYYGIIQTLDRENFTILDLPTKYCFTRYKDLKNNDIIEFDLSYFNTLMEGKERDKALSVYPKEIARAYLKYRNGNGVRYYKIPPDIGICFPFYDGRPFFLSTIPQIINYRHYEKLERKKDEEEIKKVLIQKIPHLNEGALLFEPPEAEVIHSGTVNMMKNNPNVSVLTTYADVSLEGTNSTNESISKNNLEKIAQTIYRNAGVSAQLFAATGNMALTSSIQNDLALMMSLAVKFERFITNIINHLYSNKYVKFKYTILPISYYNEKEFLDNCYKGATTGYSFLYPGIAMGMSQKDLVNIKKLENDVLKMDTLLIPLKTSYTDSSNNGAGRPQLADTQKSDKTIKNIEAAGNGSSGE